MTNGQRMQIDHEGWLPGAQQRPSPYCDDRPPGTPIDLLVIHNISLPPGEFGGTWIDDLFLGQLDPAAHPYFPLACAAGPVSTHLLIRRDGEPDPICPIRAPRLARRALQLCRARTLQRLLHRRRVGRDG